MRRHEPDIASLVTGLVFVAVAAAYLIGEYTNAHVSAGWVLPLGLIGLGVAGLTGSLRRGLRADRAATPGLPAHEPEPMTEPDGDTDAAQWGGDSPDRS